MKRLSLFLISLSLVSSLPAMNNGKRQRPYTPEGKSKKVKKTTFSFQPAVLVGDIYTHMLRNESLLDALKIVSKLRVTSKAFNNNKKLSELKDQIEEKIEEKKIIKYVAIYLKAVMRNLSRVRYVAQYGRARDLPIVFHFEPTQSSAQLETALIEAVERAEVDIVRELLKPNLISNMWYAFLKSNNVTDGQKKAAIQELLQVAAAKKGISLEPVRFNSQRNNPPRQRNLNPNSRRQLFKYSNVS